MCDGIAVGITEVHIKGLTEEPVPFHLFLSLPRPFPLQDSGLDYGEDLSTFDRQVSNPGEYGSEMAIQYTDNVAYCVVGQQAGTSEQSRGMPKQPIRVDNKTTQQPTGLTEWDPRVPDRPLGVMLRQDPNCRDKEFVTFRQAPRVPPRTHTSNSLQTSL